MIPDTIPACLSALNAAYPTLGEDDSFALAAALERASPADTIVQSFDVLRGAASLDHQGLIALAGVCQLLIRHSFNGLAAAAQDELNQRAVAIAALPPPEMPAITLPVPPGEQISDLDG